MVELTLINESLLKIYSPITDNTDIKEFVPFISIAQRLHINGILGIPLLTELLDQLKNDTLTPTNGDLILKIAPALSFWTCYQALPFHHYKIVNKGVTKMESENSSSAQMKEIGQLTQYLKDDAQILTQQLIDFLCECKDNYPLWMPNPDCKCKCDDKNEFGSAKMKYDSGVHFFKPAVRRGIGNL